MTVVWSGDRRGPHGGQLAVAPETRRAAPVPYGQIVAQRCACVVDALRRGPQTLPALVDATGFTSSTVLDALAVLRQRGIVHVPQVRPAAQDRRRWGRRQEAVYALTPTEAC